jgi:hypothetical protein
MVGRERWQIRPHLLGIGGARDKVHERSVAPIYIAVDSGDANNEVALRLPKDIALGLLTILSPDAAAEVCQVV